MVEVRLLEFIQIFAEDTEIINVEHFRLITFDKKSYLNFTDIFSTNLEILATSMIHLKTFGLEEFQTKSGDTLNLQNKIANIVAQNSATLTTLELENSRLWRKNIEYCLCPALKHLKTRLGSTVTSESLEAFLKIQGLLESLSISSLLMITRNLITMISDRSKNLKKIHLKAKGLVAAALPPQMPWYGQLIPQDNPLVENPLSFLRELTGLDEFALVVPKRTFCFDNASFGDFNDILHDLPITMRKIFLRGISGRGPIDLPNLDAMFPKLLSLSLERCEGIIDNNGFRYFCTKRTGDNNYPF